LLTRLDAISRSDRLKPDEYEGNASQDRRRSGAAGAAELQAQVAMCALACGSWMVYVRAIHHHRQKQRCNR
jgi:hypothetical protein